MNTTKAPRWSLASCLVLAFAVAASPGCGGSPPPDSPLLQNREVEAFKTVAAYPNSDTRVVLTAFQELLAARRFWEGYDYFGKLAAEQPTRRAMFRSLQGVMQARVADDIPLWKRIAWVESAIAKLDDGAAADPLLGGFARGLVFADLPPRFGKAQQAARDLEAALARRGEFPVALDRAIYRGLAVAYRALGDPARSAEMLRRSGFKSLADDEPRVFVNASVNGVDGFRFAERRFVTEAAGVYVAEGFDFANIGFIVTPELVVAIDAGTTERSARAAVDELRKRTRAPIKYIVLTHGHWDHVGGLAALREPGSVVIARTGFAEELARSRAYSQPFRNFFGTDPIPLDVTADRLIDKPEFIHEAGLDLELIPAPSGETEDALFVRDNADGLLFVGDAFMPYLGAPTVAEGSPRGFIAAAALVEKLGPRRLIHGHPPLTEVFNREAMPGLGAAAQELYDHVLIGVQAARPLAEVLHENFIPPSLRDAPKAVLPFLVMHDTFIQRIYQQEGGYWQSNGEGVDHFTRAEWATTLDLVGGGRDASFERAVGELLRRGDGPMALRIAELGLLRYPKSAALRDSRARALTMLEERYAPINPFRFILYSEWSHRDLAPLDVPK